MDFSLKVKLIAIYKTRNSKTALILKNVLSLSAVQITLQYACIGSSKLKWSLPDRISLPALTWPSPEFSSAQPVVAWSCSCRLAYPCLVSGQAPARFGQMEMPGRGYGLLCAALWGSARFLSLIGFLIWREILQLHIDPQEAALCLFAPSLTSFWIAFFLISP